jgi:S-adenosylmethionine decarboxylase proenzyme
MARPPGRSRGPAARGPRSKEIRRKLAKLQHPFDGPVDYLGRQVTVDFFDCNKALLNDVKRVERMMVAAAKASRATVVKSLFHQFNPFGVSGVVVIAESHLAIHTWPEYGFCSIDVFTCGPVVDPRICQRFLVRALKSGHSEYHEFKRGVLKLDGLSHKAIPVQGAQETLLALPASGKLGHQSKGGPEKLKALHAAPRKRVPRAKA